MHCLTVVAVAAVTAVTAPVADHWIDSALRRRRRALEVQCVDS